MPEALRAAQFTTDTLPRRVRYDAWRHLISAVFEPTMPNGHLRKDLRAEANVAYFGNALVVSTTAEAQHFTRSHRLIAAENLDHYLVQVYRAGVCEGTYGDVRNIVYPGDIKIIDLARPFHTFNTDFDNITLTLPRAALAPLLANPDGLHGTVLHRDTAEARLLAAHIEELAVSAAKLDTTVGHAVAAATLRLVAAIWRRRRCRRIAWRSGFGSRGRNSIAPFPRTAASRPISAPSACAGASRPSPTPPMPDAASGKLR